ncbi:MAG: NfeD family protein [Eubacteriales bacterium]|nr:NfeD family protein [Eubacteriales bacterium]
MISIYWLIGFVILVGIEAATMALTTIWFAGGAFVAFLLSLFGVPLEIQLGAFVVMSFLLLFLTRPFASKYINSSTVKTNADSLVGREARVTEKIDNRQETGTAVINGQEWTARAADDDETYPAGAMVRVSSIQGVKLIVTTSKEDK